MRSRTLGTIVTAAVCTAGLNPVLAASSAAGGDRLLEEVVVTAQKRAEKLQDVPIAITAITGAELATKGITTFEGIARDTPSISISATPSDASTARIFMRGQGTVDNPNTITSEGSVGIYQDGFYLARPEAFVFDAADIERVEVLRGPQGTLYGRNTTGGAVNIISKAQQGEFGLRQSLEFGNFGDFRSLTSIDLPTWNNFATKFTFVRSTFDGYTKNIGSSNDFGARDGSTGRFQLRWTPSDTLTADYFIETDTTRTTPPYPDSPDANGMVFNVGGTDYTYVGGRRQDASFAPYDLPLTRNKFNGQGLTLTWEISDQLTIKSLTGYHTLDQRGGFQVFQASGENFNEYVTRQHQFSQEVQVIGSALGEQLKYVGGLYYFREKALGYYALLFPFYSLRFVDISEAPSTAAYTQVTFIPDALDRRWEFTLGARYTRDKRDALGTGEIPEFALTFYDTTNHSEYNRFNPSATVNYRWTDDVRSYFKVASGYRAGGVYNGGLGGDNTFKPEDIVSYELGLKSEWFDKKLRLNVAAFHNTLTDMQQTVRLTTDGSARVFNVGKATINGLEFEVSALPTADLSLGFNYAYLDAKIDRFPVRAGTIYDPAVNASSPYVVGQDIRHLFTLPGAPKNSFSVNADYDFLHTAQGTFAAHLDYRWQDEVFPLIAGKTVPGRNLGRQPGYGLLNGRLSYTVSLQNGGAVDLSVWGKNLLDKEYLVTVGAYGSSSTVSGLNVPIGALAAGFAATNTQFWGQPRSYGLTVEYRY